MECLGNERDSSRPYAVISFSWRGFDSQYFFSLISTPQFSWVFVFVLVYWVFFPLQHVTIPLERKTAFKFLFKPRMDGNIWSWNT